MLRKTLGLWVRVTIKPDDAAAAILARPRPVCYVLERESRADLAVLIDACGRLGLPRPTRRLLIGGERTERAHFELERRPGLFSNRSDTRAPRQLRLLVAAATARPDFDVDLVPVAIFWGRAPLKEASWWRLPFTDEIAANYSQTFVTFMSLALARLWNRLYDGVDFEHVENLSDVGDGAEIIYVPCHRSHMDYLLLSYVIYRKGFAVPHVAAGVNLNMPVIGASCARAARSSCAAASRAMRCTRVVFMKYLGFMMARGHPLEYFIEGGRSRTGRLLSPRTGMLSMTVRSYLRDPKRPVVFMPVYFGYERIVEGRPTSASCPGARRRRRASSVCIKAFVSVLRSKFGKVHVNLGSPLRSMRLLQRHNPVARRRRGKPTSPAAWIATRSRIWRSRS
jgi:glycerol-3-phosphate O-acyltransferase